MDSESRDLENKVSPQRRPRFFRFRRAWRRFKAWNYFRRRDEDMYYARESWQARHEFELSYRIWKRSGAFGLEEPCESH